MARVDREDVPPLADLRWTGTAHVQRLPAKGAEPKDLATKASTKWPPKTCTAIWSCPPYPTTLHHGSYVDLVLR